MIHIDGPFILELHPQVLFLPGGDVATWERRLSNELTIAAKAEAPPNKDTIKTRYWDAYPPGSLIKSIKTETDINITTMTFTTTLIADVPYALFVHEGTKDIRASRFQNRNALGHFTPGFTSKGMIIPTYDDKFRRALSRKGQAANPFLRRGFNNVAARHEALRPL